MRRVAALLLLAAWSLNLLSSWDCARLGRFIETVGEWHRVLPLPDALAAAWDRGDVCGTESDARPPRESGDDAGIVHAPLFVEVVPPVAARVDRPGEGKQAWPLGPERGAHTRAEPPPTPPPVVVSRSC